MVSLVLKFGKVGMIQKRERGMDMSGKKSPHKTRRGFTRIDLTIVLACVTLISAMGLSVLGDNRERSERVVCVNNLRQIGRAYNMWANDHGGENPFWTHYNNGGAFYPASSPPPPSGVYNIPGVGMLPATLRNNAWFQFLFINQELRTPAVLVCPSDQTKLRAQEFSTDRSKGFASSTYMDRATSYFVGFHAVNQNPSSLLSGDRTLRADGQNGSCPANVGSVSVIVSTSGWVSGLHNAGGNLLLNDGRVEELSTAGFARFLAPDGVPGLHHFSSPRP